VRGADSVVLDDDDDSVDDPSRIRLMLRTNDNRKCSLIIGKVGTCSSFVARGYTLHKLLLETFAVVH